MRNDLNPEWWKRRRLWYPLTALALCASALLLALHHSGVSCVVVYNEMDSPIADLRITACGQSQTFRGLEERESVRLKLAALGGESDIAIATNGVLMWRGEYIESRGGFRAILRLGRDGQVQSTTTTSWRQSLFLSHLTLFPGTL